MSDVVKEAVEKYLERIYTEARTWAKHGPDSQIAHITGATAFGIEIECFVPRKHYDSAFVSSDEGGDIVNKVLIQYNNGKITTNKLTNSLGISQELFEDMPDKYAFLSELIRQDQARRTQLISLLSTKVEKVRYDRPTALALMNTKFPKWKWKYDTSVSESQDEVVSPVLKGKSGLIEIRSVLNTLNKCGFSIDKTCGGHTSVSYRNGVGYYTAPLALMVLWGSAEKKLHDILPAFRENIHTAQWFSKRFPIKDIISKVENTKAKVILNNYDTAPTEKYQSLSMRKFDNSRVEFRTWKGTLEYKQWAAQIGFGEFFLQQAAHLSRDFAKIRKNYLKEQGATAVERKFSNAEIKELGTTADCDCPECTNFRRENPDDWNDYLNTQDDQGLSYRWVPNGYDTEYDL